MSPTDWGRLSARFICGLLGSWRKNSVGRWHIVPEPNKKSLISQVDSDFVIMQIFLCSHLAGCSHCCNPKDFEATKERLRCPASSHPHTNSCSWCYFRGCCSSRWDCGEACQIQTWWLQAYQGKLKTKLVIIIFLAHYRKITLLIKHMLLHRVPDFLGPEGTQQHWVQVGDIVWSLQEAYWKGCCVWISNYRGLNSCVIDGKTGSDAVTSEVFHLHFK